MNTKQTTDKSVKKPEVTKQMVLNFIGAFTFVSVSYSGNDNTFYIRGVQAKDAELALLKAFPGMPFKTQSNTEPPTRDAKEYFFQKDGTMLTTLNASNIVFGCKARTPRNARRKYGNYIDALTAGTGVKWQAPIAQDKASV